MDRDEELRKLQGDAEDAQREHPDKKPLDPAVSLEQAAKEYGAFTARLLGKRLTSDDLFVLGQHIARLSMIGVFETLQRVPVSSEARATAFLHFHYRQRDAMVKAFDQPLKE